jgi:hypothetical protein
MDSWAEIDFVTSAADVFVALDVVAQETKRPLYMAAHLIKSQDVQK